MATINLNYDIATSDELRAVLTWQIQVGSLSAAPLVFDHSDGVWSILDAETREVVSFCSDWDRMLTSDSLEGLAALCLEDIKLCAGVDEKSLLNSTPDEWNRLY